ncbi:hypothetical protein EBU91_02770, partial [bacterium]|nr:hypothetical protein [bacterium]
MSSFSLRDLVLKYEEEIRQLHQSGLSKTDIAKKIVEDKHITLGSAQLDSFRRAISSRLAEPDSESEVAEHIQEKFKHEEVEDQDLEKMIQEEESAARSAFKKYKHSTDYYYDESKDLYIVYIKNKAYKFTGTIIRDMKSRYSALTGSPESINEIC